jgi:hypothetical protein
VQYGSAEARVTIPPRIDTWRVDVVTTMTARQILHAENTRLRKLCVALEMISRKAAAGMVRKVCSVFREIAPTRARSTMTLLANVAARQTGV